MCSFIHVLLYGYDTTFWKLAQVGASSDIAMHAWRGTLVNSSNRKRMIRSISSILWMYLRCSDFGVLYFSRFEDTFFCPVETSAFGFRIDGLA